MCRVEPVFGLLSEWKKISQSLIKYEISLSKNIKENVSKFEILLTLSQLYLRLQNVTGSIYKLSIQSVHRVLLILKVEVLEICLPHHFFFYPAFLKQSFTVSPLSSSHVTKIIQIVVTANVCF